MSKISDRTTFYLSIFLSLTGQLIIMSLELLLRQTVNKAFSTPDTQSLFLLHFPKKKTKEKEKLNICQYRRIESHSSGVNLIFSIFFRLRNAFGVLQNFNATII